MYHCYYSNTLLIVVIIYMLYLQTIPNKSMVVFHACAHNPTGIDLDVRMLVTNQYVMQTVYPYDRN